MKIGRIGISKLKKGVSEGEQFLMSDRAIKTLLNKLDKLSDNEDMKIEILNESIFNNWQSVYPLKENSEAKENNVVPFKGKEL